MISSGIYGGDPQPEQNVPSTTSTVLLDSKQVALIAPTSKPTTFLQRGGLGEGTVSGLLPSPVPYATTIPITKTSSISTGTNISLPGEGIGPGKFSATINPMSGCSRTQYFGSFTSGSFWDTHRGNSILSMRVMIEPDDPVLANDGDFFIKDFYIKVPDGFVFREALRKTRSEVAVMMNYLIQNRTFRSDYPNVTDGWGPVEEAGFSELDVGTESGFAPLFSFALDPSSQRFFIKMNLNNLIEGYKESKSSFVVFDHLNSLTTRGALWSGFGSINNSPGSLYERSQQEDRTVGLKDSKFRNTVLATFRYKAYFGIDRYLYRHYSIDPNSFNGGDPTTGAMTKNGYFFSKNDVWNTILGISDIDAASPEIRTLYAAVRAGTLKDSRYTILNSTEISFDRKLNPFVNIGSPSTIGPNTFGIVFNSYEKHESSVASSFSSKPWRDTDTKLDSFHASIFLSKNASTMRIEIEGFNEYGDTLLPSTEGQAPGARGFLGVGGGGGGGTGPGVGFVPPILPTTSGDVLPPLIAFCKMRFPNAAEEGTNSISANFPPWSYYKNPPPAHSSKLGKRLGGISFPSSISLIAAKKEDLDLDLLGYFDNGARIGAYDSVTHFLQNKLY